MKLFEDLPSTNTPINAENLNRIQDKLVVVSATEPTDDDREKIWIQNTDLGSIIHIKNDDDLYEEICNLEETSWLTLNSTIGTYYKRTGKNVELNLSVWNSSGISLTGYAETVLGSLPEGFRPSKNIYIPVFAMTTDNESLSCIRLIINTDGNVYLHNWGPGASCVSINGYINFIVD